MHYPRLTKPTERPSRPPSLRLLSLKQGPGQILLQRWNRGSQYSWTYWRLRVPTNTIQVPHLLPTSMNTRYSVFGAGLYWRAPRDELKHHSLTANGSPVTGDGCIFLLHPRTPQGAPSITGLELASYAAAS